MNKDVDRLLAPSNQEEKDENHEPLALNDLFIFFPLNLMELVNSHLVPKVDDYNLLPFDLTFIVDGFDHLPLGH